jgi:WhiB family redox-sensing transcriptional regulator
MAEFQLADGVKDASGGPPGQLRGARREAAGEDWRVIAACQSVDPELFFPISVAGKGLEEAAEAKRVCARCLVQAECLTFAHRTGQVHGIWGGLTEEERIRVRRREPAAALRSGLAPDVTLAQHLLQPGDPDDPAGTR